MLLPGHVSGSQPHGWQCTFESNHAVSDLRVILTALYAVRAALLNALGAELI